MAKKAPAKKKPAKKAEKKQAPKPMFDVMIGSNKLAIGSLDELPAIVAAELANLPRLEPVRIAVQKR